jgi:excinuclease ABC subunit B
MGVFDVLVGVNLLREGLDLPEVSLVAIMDADKEGFLRNQRSLIQTIGRAARNVNGKVVMYADTITDSMQAAIDETNRRRVIQQQYNEKHGIVPQSVGAGKSALHDKPSVLPRPTGRPYVEPDLQAALAADPVVEYLTAPQLEKLIKETKKKMEAAAKEMHFMEAARLRDEFFALEEKLKALKSGHTEKDHLLKKNPE